jgi:hypothetical protein
VLALLQSNIDRGLRNSTSCDFDHFAHCTTHVPEYHAQLAQERRSMSSPPWNTAAYWRELAAQTRKLADEVKDAPTKAMILRAAGEYDERSETG